MKNVILYTRVSTDEQADGCSLDIQERYLKAYCSNHDLHVIGDVYREDYSAKHYDLRRPEMKKIYQYCKKHRGEVDAVLFLRWDRYSRNVEFAFTYKRKFYDELGIEINAIESPIDFKSPEWSMLLSMYCGAAHTEDEKISRRTKDGIHGTLLKGKCANKAPRGYKNCRRDKHDCWIEIDEPKASKIRTLFYEVAKGVEVPTNIKRRYYPELADSTFFDILRNRFYIGEIHVPAYGNDPEQYVQGQHQPLIDKHTFDLVQEVIDRKKKKDPKLSKKVDPDLYLRKFLTCPICGAKLTGSKSKGNGGYYHYYHCSHDHKHANYRADEANKGFVQYVSKLKPNAAVLALYNEILQDVRGEKVKANHLQADKLQKDVEVLDKRMDAVQNKYYDGEITASEKTKQMARYEDEKANLQRRIDTLRLSADLKVKEKLDYSINIIGNLAGFFSQASPEVKIKLLGSIFPEKIEYDGKKYRTKNYNKMLDIIFQETKHLEGRKKKEVFPQ
jgi:DNA invertase Pin-like site-specific DNA recombinase